MGFKAEHTPEKQTTQTKQLPFEVQGWRLTLICKCPYTVTSIMSDDTSLLPFSGKAWSSKDIAAAQAICLAMHEDAEDLLLKEKEKEDWTLPVGSPSSADSWDLDELTPIPKTLDLWLEKIPDQPGLFELKDLICDLQTEWRMAILLLDEAEDKHLHSDYQLQKLHSRFDLMQSMVMPLVEAAWQKAHPRKRPPWLWEVPRENTLALGRATRARKGDFEHQTKKKARN